MYAVFLAFCIHNTNPSLNNPLATFNLKLLTFVEPNVKLNLQIFLFLIHNFELIIGVLSFENARASQSSKTGTHMWRATLTDWKWLLQGIFQRAC